MKNIGIRQEFKIWLIYLGIVFFSFYFHEIGHCLPAWINGIRAIPTPAKEYISNLDSPSLAQNISLGGIVATIFFSSIIIFLYSLRSFNYDSTLLSASIVLPGIYSLRFLLMGRGHDANEFQEAQSTLGFNYSGHFLDWAFLSIFLIGVFAWILKSKPKIRILWKILIGAILTLIFVVCLQHFNNILFDPIFQG